MTGIDVLRWTTQVAFVGLAWVAIREWRRQRTDASAWLALTFSAVGLVIVATLVLPSEPDGALLVAQRAVIVALLLFPWLLSRFANAIEALPRSVEAVAHGLTVAVLVATVALPRFPEEGEPTPDWLTAYTALALASWMIISALVAWRLWRAGAGQPDVARRRMQLIAIASVALATALVTSGVGDGDNDTSVALVQLAALVSAASFYVGYAPPRLVRLAMRRDEELAMRRAEFDLLRVTTVDEVRDILLPRAGAILGSERIEVVPEDGPAPEPLPNVIDIPMSSGGLRIHTNPYAPVFGDEEVALVESLAAVADLAIERAHLLEQERAVRHELQRANAELEQFAYTASHDLRAPLQVIMGFAELLQRDQVGLSETGQRHLEHLKNAAERMHALVDDLLTLSRIGQTDEPLENVDLTEIAGHAVDMLRSQIDECGGRVEIGRLPVARAHSRLVTQVFQNLIGNGLKYGAETSPRVTVWAVRRDGEVEVGVSDNGPGIPPQHREDVFLPFKRLQGSEGPVGTGIGLPIVRKIVELHGGRVWIDAGAQTGTTFRFTLPGPAAATETSAAASDARSPSAVA